MKKILIIVLALVLLLPVIASIRLAQPAVAGEVKIDRPYWMAPQQFKASGIFHYSGPLEYSLTVGTIRPGQQVGISFCSWTQDEVSLPGLIEFKLTKICVDGNTVKVIDREIREARRVTRERVFWQTRVPDVAPANYRLSVILRDKDGHVFGKLMTTLHVPPQELNAATWLNKWERVIGIARTDHRVQEFLALGAVVECVQLVPVFTWCRDRDGVLIATGAYKAALTIELRKERWVESWFITVDVVEEKVAEQIYRAITWEIWVPPAIPTPPISEETRLKAIRIIRAHPLVGEILAKGHNGVGAIITGTNYLRTITCENGRAIISCGQDKVEVHISGLRMGGVSFRTWCVVVNLAEERVESIEERVFRFDWDRRDYTTEERRIYP